MLELIAMLGKEAALKAAASPIMKLGESVMAGNVAGGLGDFAKSAIAPQMEFGKAMMDPNASGIDAFMKMQKEMGNKTQAPMLMAGMPEMQNDQLPQMQSGPASMPSQPQSRMQINQGLPPGLLAQLGYRR